MEFVMSAGGVPAGSYRLQFLSASETSIRRDLENHRGYRRRRKSPDE